MSISIETAGIEVSNIVKMSNNTLEVVYSNGATQLLTYDFQASTGVFYSDRELKSERYTKKYKSALKAYQDSVTTNVDTGNTNGVFHNVYIVGEIAIAHKIIDGEIVQKYDWTGNYSTTEKLIKETVYASGHEKYTFIEILTNDQISENKATDLYSQILGMTGYDHSEVNNSNLLETLKDFFHKLPNYYFASAVLDSEKSLHITFISEHSLGGYEQRYNVLSAYNNGTGDRTTYSGLHRGTYDLDSDGAYNEELRRSKGARLSRAGFIY